jgi:Zn-dependent metalloprotease
VRYIKQFALITILLAFTFLSLTDASAPFRKSGNAANTNPFIKKTQQHQKADVASPQYQLFLKDIKNLSQKTVSFRNQVRTAAPDKNDVRQEAEIERLRALNQGELFIYRDGKNGLPLFITAKKLQEQISSKQTQTAPGREEIQALSFLDENRRLLQIKNPVAEFKLSKKMADRYGHTHLRYQQTYQELEVWGADIVVHLNRDAIVDGFNGRYLSTPDYLSLDQIVVSEETARNIAAAHFSKPPREIASKKMIFAGDLGRAHFAWYVNIKSGLAENWIYFVDAASGRILKSYNHVMTDGPAAGSGMDLLNQNRDLGVYQIGSDFTLIDASKPMYNASTSTMPNDGKGVIYTLDANNAEQDLYLIVSNSATDWTDKSGVSASANGALVYDFYSQVFGRNAIDGNGTTMNLIVNFGQDFNNAFWNGQYMVFGNGDGSAFSELAAALDVTAHEMTHGVIERTANLVYENQSGALNESFADVFGVLFEFWAEGESANWLLGEDITTPSVAGDALRNMQDPGASNVAFGGQQPAKMSEYNNLPNTPDGDYGGVHVNSGIPNKAFYLFATDPAVGLEKAGEIYYQALTNYLTRNAQFIDCRLAVVRSIDDVYGANTAEAIAAKTAAAQAFDAVEIFDGSATPPPPVQEPVLGQEYLAVIDAASAFLWRYDLLTPGIMQISANALFSRPTVTDDGSLIFYVDQTTNLHLLAYDGSGDLILTESGGFANVAISRSGRYLAATSIFNEPYIYIFDMFDESGQGDKQIRLYTPTTAEGTAAGNVLFPDRIDWSSDDDILMYDAFNIIVHADGDTTGYWDINLLRASDSTVNRLFPPQAAGINIGNAVYASNTDNIIALDYMDEGFNVSVLGVNLNTGDIGVITENAQSLASPSFSNDDSKIYYHYADQNGASVWVVDLENDGITGTGNDQGIINGGVYPVAFTFGTRPTGIEDVQTAFPSAFNLLQNYPNPFNPSTTIAYELPENAGVKLVIYDINGRSVKNIVSAEQVPGRYTVN